MDVLLAGFLSTAVSLAVIPLMVRMAPILGMLDEPDTRKVHRQPIPRVGGWGIVVGTVLSVLWFLPWSPLTGWYLFGATVLVGFGAWDDRRELAPRLKFLGQVVAIVPVVVLGDLYVTSLPFGIGELSPAVGKGFTVFALMGMANAINHSDGLDGLAGGEALISLGAITLLMYLSGDEYSLLLAAACMGGIFGFLRYNTHPARLFMGDCGSQYLGFTLGFLAVLLSQRIDPTMSPAAVLLLLGLPVADILVVLYKRVKSRMRWFHATKNHIHHRLLALGFVHAQSVMIMYTVHTLLVVSGVLLSHGSNALALGLYLGVSGALFALLSTAERSGWRANRGQVRARLRWLRNGAGMEALVVLPRQFIGFAIPAFLLFGVILAPSVPRDYGVAAGVLALSLMSQTMFPALQGLLRRISIFTLIALIMFLHLPGQVSGEWLPWLARASFVLLGLSIVLAIRYSPRRRATEFDANAMDYLLVILLGAGLVSAEFLGRSAEGMALVAKLGVLFYAAELMMVESRERWNRLTVSAVVAVGILGLRAAAAA